MIPGTWENGPSAQSTRTRLDAISRQLTAVTGQAFRFELASAGQDELLCSWSNETQVGYVLSCRRCSYRSFQLSLGCRRGHEIETRFDRLLETVELERLLADPRTVVRLFLAQQSVPGGRLG
ncbi:MAG: hypothetical protein RBU37_10345 [Myxococcota bacterium]|jgi:hypothetical protein|nr:hypothetical protein [Myxococcota bacterium]